MIADDLERLYQDARAALKARDYDRASDLLKQILITDDNYRDASRLLAQAVRLKRRRWYNDPRLWGTVGAVLLIGLGIFLLPKAQRYFASQSVPPTGRLTATLPPTAVLTATATLLPTPTPIPLAWKRLATGQGFERDTVSAFAADSADPDVIYAGMKNAGVYKTIDGGLSWRPSHQGLANTQIQSLLIDSNDPRRLYAGTVAGIYRTEDGGDEWFRIGDGTFLLMDAQDNSHLYARDENGIYETMDQGSTWDNIYSLSKECPDVISSWAIHPTNADTLFIAGGGTCTGVYQSIDGGRTWALIGLEGKPDLRSLFTRVDKGGNHSVYVEFVSRVEADSGLFVTRDGGANWSFLGTSCNLPTADPENPATIYCGAGFPRVMQEGVDRQQRIPGPAPVIVVSALHVDHPNGTDRIIMAGTDVGRGSAPEVGIFITDDGGGSWARKDAGLGSTRVHLSLDPVDAATIYVATYFSGYISRSSECMLYRSLNGGLSWQKVKWGANWCGPALDAARMLYLIELAALQKSWDGGDTWAWEWDGFVSPRELPSASTGSTQSVSANPYFEGLIYDVGEVIHYSTDSGGSWHLSQGSEGSWDARLFYADQGKKTYAIGRYHQSYSDDNGRTWHNCGQDVTASASDSRLAHDPQGSRLYLATPGDGVLVSIDNCGSWQPRNEGLGNLFVNTLAVDPNDAETVYAGTDGGAYISFDSGETWGQVNDGLLGATVVYSIAVDKDSNVYAATPYGVFKLEGQ